VLADHYGERKLLLVGLGASVFGIVSISMAPTLPTFALLLLLLGAGTGLFYPPATVLATRLYDEHGAAIGTLAAFGAFAGLVYPAAGGFMAEYLGWRPVFGSTAILTGVVILATARFVPRIAPANAEGSLASSIDVSKYSTLLGQPGILYTIALAVILIFTFQGISSFYPAFLVEYHNIDRGLAGGMLGGVLGVSTVAQPLSGRFSDAVSRDAALAASISFIIASLAVLVLVTSFAGAVLGSLLLGAGISYPGPLQARFMDLLDDGERGYGFGLLRTVYMFLGASGSVVVGALSDTTGWVAAYGAIGALLVGCLLLLAVNRLFSLGL
jgi:predicted MFS family arabinose efflux permease